MGLFQKLLGTGRSEGAATTAGTATATLPADPDLTGAGTTNSVNAVPTTTGSAAEQTLRDEDIETVRARGPVVAATDPDSSDADTSDAGDPKDSDSGDAGSGDSDSGDAGSGDSDSGDAGTADSDSGDAGTGSTA